ncbi:MAG: DUF4397 domain-containing protein [Sphingobacteriales bacterium]|nr:DUF4397 domain-containing protein [Sphingobacteriales bacterium]
MKINSLKNYQLLALIIFGSIYILVSCKMNTPILSFGESHIRLINASPDNNAIDFYINDTLKNSSPLAFGQNTNYATISGGVNHFQVKANGNLVNHSDLTFQLDTNKYFTVFVAGNISKDSMSYVSLQDDLKVLSDTTAKVRFVNLVSNSPYLDVVVSTNPQDSIPSFSGINFGSGADYKEFKSGNYTIKFRQTGKNIDLASPITLQLDATKIYTLWAKGFVNGIGAQALSPSLLTDN